ncbi:MAG: hypothetical protein H0Z34_12190 [Brevibacillus sp.]|nr:hypothetical protein [Brevibacillus sp.]
MFQGGSVWAGVISGGISQLQDTQSLMKGQVKRSDYYVRTTGNLTGAVGVMAGVEYGGMLGTAVFPGIGTVVGAVLGAMAGDQIGRTIGRMTASALFQPEAVQPVPRLMEPLAQPVTQPLITSK